MDIMPLIHNSSDNYIKLTDNEAIVLSLVNDVWKSNRTPASCSQIYSKLKNTMPAKRIKFALVGLHAKGKIIHPEGSVNWIPILSEDELQMKESMERTGNVSDEKIIFIIRKLFLKNGEYPKPSEIEDAFLLQFGRPSIADFGRHLRKMAEEGKLLRTEDFEYFLKNMDQAKPLRRWMW